MRNIFPAYYRPNETDLNELWQEATIALDANVLLNLYRYPAQARKDLVLVLQKLSDRLFVPYQAALEYQRQRLLVIAAQLKRFDEVRKVLSDFQNQLRGKFGELQLGKRHASIDPHVLLDRIKEECDSFVGGLEALEKEHPGISNEDEIRNTLDYLLDGKIGPAPTQKDLEEIYSEGKKRYESRCPPGYMDADKAREKEPVFMWEGLRIERQYGDLILWKQILAVSAVSQAKPLIFVTDDDKEDWWWRIDYKGEQTIGPRPELVEEIQRLAGVSSFHMYSSEQFIKYAKETLNLDIQDKSIEQIREAREQDGVLARQILRMKADLAVHMWLARIHRSAQGIADNAGFPDFIVTLADGSRVGYELRLPPFHGIPVSSMPSMMEGLKRLYIVWVSPDGPMDDVVDYLALPPRVSVVLGHLEYPLGAGHPLFVPDREFPPVAGVSA